MIKILDPYKEYNVEYIDLEPEDGKVDMTRVRSLQVGYGSRVLRIDRDGLWIGAKRFADAPFSVDMEGRMVATSLTISGYIPTGGALGDIGVGGITGTYISSGAITTPKLSATAIDGMTITGAEIRTSASGARVVMDGTTDTIYIYDASAKRMQLDNDEISFYNSSGTKLGGISTPTTTNFTIKSTTGNYLVLDTVGSGAGDAIAFSIAGTVKASVTSSGLHLASNIVFDGAYDITGVDDITFDSTSSVLNMNSGNITNIDEMYFIENTGNPSTAGQMHYYNTGGVQEFQCVAGSFVGSIDLTAT